ncbi:LacI family DNA-binding transcriptional regulator [Bifidobacterium felsineum]|uniref:LacI family DNA-binding transcriptional regulator n=1 Tax=Bifidobacterium felsineum TaxID=2045440 RepID=UPI001F0B1B03|nr:LacI family DNA-binding transcriptional regulator [Bifidobacterium felsineum]
MAEQQRKATDRVRLADVADAAGVAISTVSRVFSNPDRVNFQTVEQVREVAERLGYRPNPRKRHIAAAQSPMQSQVQSPAPAQLQTASQPQLNQPIASMPFHTSSAAQNHATASGGVIALVVKDTTDGISSQILKGAQITAMESGSAVGLIEAGQSQQRTQQLLTHLIGKVDGVILVPTHPESISSATMPNVCRSWCSIALWTVFPAWCLTRASVWCVR